MIEIRCAEDLDAALAELEELRAAQYELTLTVELYRGRLPEVVELLEKSEDPQAAKALVELRDIIDDDDMDDVFLSKH